MKDYTSNNPVFSENIKLLETTTPGHADNFNLIVKQLLQNTLVLKKLADEQQKVIENCPEDVTEALETTKEEVLGKVEEILDSAPESLNSFKELADALGNDPNYAATMIKKFAELSTAAYAQTITSYDDLMANSVEGYLVDAVAVKAGLEALATKVRDLEAKLGTQVTYSVSGEMLTITPK
ncbi:MAG: hypothetical protein NC417_09075 [Candidatus Gastranaerophilales bacterium]|nr:hypothetical protein [Candidatus Gastranaerophilales bacterium]